MSTSEGRTASPARGAGKNRLLDAVLRLEPSLTEHVDFVEHAAGTELYDEDRRLAFMLFPLSGVLSCLLRTRDGDTSEVLSVGNEGLLGLSLFFGVKSSPYDIMQQLPGVTARLPIQILRLKVQPRDSLEQLFHCYAAYTLRYSYQETLCHTVHALPPRVARGLLIALDRAGSVRFQMPQLLLAKALGAARSSVSEEMTRLAHAGLVVYKRTWVTVHDRPALERRACECYAVTERYRRRVLGSIAGPIHTRN